MAIFVRLEEYWVLIWCHIIGNPNVNIGRRWDGGREAQEKKTMDN